MKANFYILLIVAINQIFSFQSSSGGFTVVLNDEENAQVKKNAQEVGNFLSLSDIKTLPEKNITIDKTIKDCYDENKENYQNMIKFFIDQITNAGNNLETALNGKCSQQVKVVQKNLKDLVDLLQKYPDDLSKQLNNLARAITRIRNNSFAIVKHVERFYLALMDIQKTEKTKADDAMSTFKAALDEVQVECENTVLQIKTCLGETGPFIPIMHIDNQNQYV